MTELEQKLYDQVVKDHPYIVGLRRYFHMHPELARQELNTARRIEAELDEAGISHERVAESGVYAEIKGRRGGDRTIVLRSDIDALPIQETHQCDYTSTVPGVMHACGHDAHTAALIGAARILAANTDKFGGTVRLTFQAGEEIGYGARVFVDGGYLDGADRTFGAHAASNVPAGSVVLMSGPNNASVDWFKITIKGYPAHVSTPELGTDAAYIASQIVVSAQALITRRTSPMENVLIGIGKITAGDAYNIVAGHAEIEGTIRVLTPELRAQVKTQLKELAETIARMYGGEAEVTYKDFTSPLINDEAATEEACRVARSLFGADKVITSRKPSLGGDDFAEYILKVPGVYAYIGTANTARKETMAAHHDSIFDIDEDSLTVSVALYTAYAIEYLNGL